MFGGCWADVKGSRPTETDKSNIEKEQIVTGGLAAPVFGPSTHTIDTDGRLIIPKRLRELLGHKFILTRGVEKCLWMLPEHLFASFVNKWTSEMSLLDRNSRMLDWRFVGQAVSVQPDGQYRVVIPPELRASAELQTDVVALALMNRVELWDLKSWRDYEASLDEIKVQDALDMRLGLQPAVPVQGE